MTLLAEHRFIISDEEAVDTISLHSALQRWWRFCSRS